MGGDPGGGSMGGTAFRSISRAVWPNAKRRQKDIEARWVQNGDANHNGYPSSTFAAHFRAAFGAVQPLMDLGFGISWYSAGGSGLVVALVVSSVFVLRTFGLGFVRGAAPYWQTQVEDVTQYIADFNTYFTALNGYLEVFVATNESTFIPAGHQHRLENPGVIDKVMIGVQSGDCLNEYDVVRFQDVCGRC
jgi:hypothetical protein